MKKTKTIDLYVNKAYHGCLQIILSVKARKQLKKIPYYIRAKFEYWCDLIKFVGLMEARKYKGFHDEPLKGQRQNQRSVRLSKSYRVIYVEVNESKNKIIEVVEVNKHEY